jgi:ankyrin repeat protein
MSSSLGRLLSSIVDPVIDASLVDNTTRLLDVLNGLSPERLHKVLTRTDERGFTPLHLAAERNQPESLKCLLIKDANPNIRSTLTTSEITPLHIAARHGHLASLQLLVQLGGDIMIQDKCHLTPVDYAQINGQDLCFNYLNEVIAQRQAEERTGVEDVLIQVELNLAVDNVQTLNHWKQLNDLFPLTLNTRDPSQLESVMYRHCIIINNRDVVRVLGRICKDIPISLHGASLLHAACRYGRTELTQLLVTKMPEILFSITNEAYNPLHVAVVHQHLEIVKILVSSQSSSFPRTQRGTDAATSGDRDASFSTSLHLQQARFGD